MTVLDDLSAIGGRTDLTGKEKQRLYAARKAAELATRLDALLPRTYGAVTLTGVSFTDRIVTIEGAGGGISWPVKVANPPMLVEDPAGAIVRTSTSPDGSTTTVRFRLDPAQALRDLLVGLARRAR